MAQLPRAAQSALQQQYTVRLKTGRCMLKSDWSDREFQQSAHYPNCGGQMENSWRKRRVLKLWAAPSTAQGVGVPRTQKLRAPYAEGLALSKVA